MIPDFTLAMMAGGKSSRMGRNKALLKIGQQTMLQRIIERTANLRQVETILVTNTPAIYADYGLPMVADILPDCGALGGIYTALYYSKTHHVLVIACDMPFVSADVIRLMLSEIEDNDVLVPLSKGYPHGLHAIYTKSCLEPILQRLEQGSLKVNMLYDDVRVKYIDEKAIAEVDDSAIALMNVNTPEDLDHANDIISNSSD